MLRGWTRLLSTALNIAFSGSGPADRQGFEVGEQRAGGKLKRLYNSAWSKFSGTIYYICSLASSRTVEYRSVEPTSASTFLSRQHREQAPKTGRMLRGSSDQK